MNFDEMVAPKGTDLQQPGVRAHSSRSGVVVGGVPAVSLMPGELRHAARDRAIRRVLIFGLAGVLGVTGGAVLLAVGYAGSAQSRFDDAQSRAQSLAVQIAKFGPVSQLQTQIAVGDAAVKVGTSTTVDWQTQIDALEQYMPSGFTVTTITADSASVTTDYGQGTTPLELPRAATVVLTADSKDITGVPHWLRMIRQIPGYADADAQITHDDTTGYSVEVTAHLGAKAIDKNAWKEWVK